MKNLLQVLFLLTNTIKIGIVLIGKGSCTYEMTEEKRLLALLKAFATAAKAADTTDAQDAWCAAYQLVAESMANVPMGHEERVGISLEVQNIIRSSHLPIILEASTELIEKLTTQNLSASTQSLLRGSGASIAEVAGYRGYLTLLRRIAENANGTPNVYANRAQSEDFALVAQMLGYVVVGERDLTELITKLEELEKGTWIPTIKKSLRELLTTLQPTRETTPQTP